MRERLRTWLPVVAIFAALAAICGTAGFMITSSHSGRSNVIAPAVADTTSSIGVVTLPAASSSPSQVASPLATAAVTASTPSSTPSSIEATTSPSATGDGLDLPEAATVQLAGAPRRTIFGRYSVPIPGNWKTSISSDIGTLYLADMTTCNDDVSNCPQIVFVDLTNGLQNIQFGTDDPAHKWLDWVSCASGGDKQPVQGPATGAIHGQRVQYFVQRCGLDPYATPNLVWYFPGLKLMVAGKSGDNGSLSPGVMRSVLEGTTW